jgi:hypothetical protein
MVRAKPAAEVVWSAIPASHILTLAGINHAILPHRGKDETACRGRRHGKGARAEAERRRCEPAH